MKLAIITAAMVLGIPMLAFAKDKCTDPQDQATMNECAGASLRASDKKLNDLYRQIEARLKDDDTKKLLMQAQRNWVKFRDTECTFQTSGGGSAGPMLAAMCFDRLTQTRVKDFEGYLKCPEGDIACPVPPAN